MGQRCLVPKHQSGNVFLALLWKGFVRPAHCVLNPITLFNAEPQSDKLEKTLAGAYAFLPNGSFLQAERGLVSFGAYFHKPHAESAGIADIIEVPRMLPLSVASEPATRETIRPAKA